MAEQLAAEQAHKLQLGFDLVPLHSVGAFRRLCQKGNPCFGPQALGLDLESFLVITVVTPRSYCSCCATQAGNFAVAEADTFVRCKFVISCVLSCSRFKMFIRVSFGATCSG